MCKIIKEITFEELGKKINEALKDSYKASGGVTAQNVNYNGKYNTLYIALMVKEDNENNENKEEKN